MFPYVIIIGITALLTWLGEEIKQEKTRKVISILAVVFPAIMAGIRYRVGTDYLHTYEPFFLEVINSETFFPDARFEFGYVLINVLIGKILNLNFHWVMFVCSLITIGFIKLAIIQYRGKINVTIAITVFMLLYYQMSLNLVRQLMAVAIVFYALTQLNKSKVKYILLVLLACIFQKTAIIMVAIPIIAPLYTERKYRWLGISALILLVVVILNYKLIYSWLINVDFLRYYVKSYLRTEEAEFSIGILVRTVPYIIPFFFLNEKDKQNKDVLIMQYIFIIGSVLRLLAYVTSTYAERIAIYFTITQVFLVGYCVRNMIKARKVISIGLLGYTAFLWYYDFFIQNMNETNPYVTIFQIM